MSGADDSPRDADAVAALKQATWLQDMFEQLALEAAERRIAFSIDQGDVAEAMFFLDVYTYVNGGNVLSPTCPAAAHAGAAATIETLIPTDGSF